MSESLPSFRSGEPLTAAALNSLTGRVRLLQQRLRAGGGLVVRRRRVLPGRAFAFQLAELNGGIWVRQGWLDVAGELVKVGEEEWTLLGAMQECTVWLEVTAGAGGVSGAVVLVPGLDWDTPATALRRRLGYVRAVRHEGDPRGWACVQVAGGLLCPAAPRRQQGRPVDYSSEWRKADVGVSEAGWLNNGAGVDAWLNYEVSLGGVVLPREDGGMRTGLTMGFDMALYR